ncbi:TPA: interaptin [Legionella anisa]
MAKKNKEFLQRLQNTTLLRGMGTAKEITDALDAMLKVNVAQLKDFRGSVCDHETVWKQIHTDFEASKWRVGNARTSNTLLDATDPTDTFQKMHQAAAEQRVKFALTGADPEVLIGLLTTDFTDNGKQLREYLEQKQNSLGMKFNEIYGWNPANEDVLTKAALNNIRTEAANHLLLKTLAKPGLTDPKLFDDLVQAQARGNIGEIKAAAKALITAGGIDLHGAPPEAFTDALTVDLSPEIVAEATRNREKLLNDAAVAKFYEQKVKDVHIIGLEVSLKKIGRDLLDDLLNPLVAGHLDLDAETIRRIKALPQGERDTIGAKVQKELCERFIQAQLQQAPVIADPKHVADLLNSNAGGFAVPLKVLVPTLGDDNIINKAIPDDNNIVKFKVALLKHRLANMTLDQLQTLDKATKPDDFAKKFATLLGKDTAGHDTKLDFLKPEHINGVDGLREIIRGRLGNLKRDERTTAFEAKVEELARFGKDAHKELIKVFKELPNEKQQEILKEPQKLLLVINAKSESEIQSHFGMENKSGGALDVTQLLAENERAAAFSKIYNPTIAKILMKLPYVTPDKVDAINGVLLAQKDLDFTAPVHYQNLINLVHGACAVPALNKNAFYAAFNLVDDNSNNLVDNNPGTVTTKIKEEHQQNKPLLDALHGVVGATSGRASNDAEKELVKVLLRVGATIPGMDTVDHIQDVYKDKFQGSTSVHTFLGKLITGTSAPEIALKEKISRELTPDVYSKLRGDYYKQVMGGADEPKKIELVKGLNLFLEGVQESKSTIKKYKDHLEVLTEDLQSLPLLYSGTNEAKARKKAEKMLGDYKEFEKQCDTLIEHLETAKHDLQVRLDNTKPIPAPDGTPERTKLIKELTELHTKLEAEIKYIDKQLPDFHAIKKQISGKDGAIAKIEGIMSHKLTAMVETTNISYSVVSRDQIKTTAFQKKAGATDIDLTAGEANLSTDSPTYKLEEVPEKGKVRLVDMVHAKPTPTRDDPNKTTEYTGRIAIDYHSGTPPSILSGKDVTNTRPVKVSIVTAMKDKDYLAEQMLEAAKNLLKDWDGKSPIKLKGVHGKDAELAHFWTAVCVLGEHHPNFSRDKIQIVGTSSWRPDSQRTWRGFKDDSLYNTVYKGSAKGLVDEKIKEFKQLVDDKKRNQVEEGLSKATQLWKKELDKGKPQDITSKVEKDMAVQGSKQSRLTMGGDEED